jgi:hypothetical protein
LGWRSKIAGATTDPIKIGDLRRALILHTRVMSARDRGPILTSTFSDNVVISAPASASLVKNLVGAVAAIQMTSLNLGFLIRGGVTIGELYHDREAVFGPALNRAYELENCVADYPRVVLDPEVATLTQPNLVATEEGVAFVDPYTIEYLQEMFNSLADDTSLLSDDQAWISPDVIRRMSPYDQIKSHLDNLKKQIRMPIEDEPYRKIAWLFDRLAFRLGVPPASSYPRVRPGDVV